MGHRNDQVESNTSSCRDCGCALVQTPGGEKSRLQRIFFGYTKLGGSVEVVRWVCLSCGFVEHRVPTRELSKLREKLKR